MKKKVIMLTFVLIISIAMVAAATMAWFTDFAEAGQATFEAGIVSIKAGASTIFSQYFNPEESIFLYGVIEKTDNTSGLYEINMKNGDAHLIHTIETKEYDTYSPNGLAYDKQKKRLYYSMVKNTKSDLYFYDFKTKETTKAGTLDGKVYGAAFYKGSYWFIKNESDVLVEVKLKSDGTISDSSTTYKITGGKKKFGFGDVVFDIKDGTIYGSATEAYGNVFFSYRIGESDSYTEINTNKNSGAIGLQIAFGSDGKLYGHSTSTGDWYSIDPDTGVKTKISIPTENKYNDIASGYISVWNPGDEDVMKYYVINDGTKRIRVRAKIAGSWGDEGLDKNSVVSITLDDDNWTDEYGDGYYYYKGILKPGEKAELRLKIKLDGPKTDNKYQGKTYTLTGSMEAIQASNGAPLAEWNVMLDVDYPVTE